MKFLHLGDLHIGKSLGDFDLYEDQKYIFNKLIDIAKENKVEAVLIAGDVYDKAIPSETAVSLFNAFLTNLSDSGFKTFIIPGNHDSDERLNFGSVFFERSGIYISAKYDGILSKKEFQDEHGKINIYLMPFIKASQVRRFYPDANIENYDDAVKVVLENSNINADERNILVAHQFVAGKSDPDLSGSEGAAVKNVGLVEKISADSFEAFDYVALGHIHSAQSVGREKVRYSGSPLKYSLSEANRKKYATIVSIGEKGSTETELIELEPLRDLRHIKGKMRQLLDAENIIAPDDYMYVTLTDEDMVGDVMNVFRQYYPNTVKIDYDNAHTRELEHIDITRITERKSFEDMISEFYLKMYGCEINEDEIKIMKETAREAGVTDETD